MSATTRQHSAEPPGTAVTAAVRAAARFDRRAVSVAGGLLAAIPVVVVLGVGLALGQPVPGVTMGAGAMLVGIAWRITGGRAPVTLMAVDAVGMATSTFVGCVTGSVLWVHLLVLCLWSLMGGLLVGVGNRGGVVGNQAIIAAVVFGRFSEPVPAALGLAGLVLVGGLTQAVFQSIVRWPLPLRAQRTATAAAYRELARLAQASDEASALAPATAMDEAETALASPTLFADAAVMTLRSLVSEAYRLRIQLIALHALLQQQPEPDADARALLGLTASTLHLAADAIEGHGDTERLDRLTAELTAAAQRRGEPGGVPSPGDLTTQQITRRLAALSGQVRAVDSLAPAAGAGGGLRSRRPLGRTNRPGQRLRSYLDQLRANMSLDSPAGRHAVRLAVIVPLATLIARELPLERGYWMVVAAATVLRPEFGATFTRGTERALGTALGVALAGGIAVLLHPGGAETVALVGVLAWAGYATFAASFAVGFAFITALVVFLLNAITPDTLATASARLVDTLVGGAIGLIAYALWPTWAHVSAWQSLGDVVAAERAYMDRVLTVLTEGRRAPEAELRRLSRRARLARTRAESTVARSLSEPAQRRIDARRSQALLGSLRRAIQAAHVLRLDVQESRRHQPLPELEPLRTGLDQLLSVVEQALRDDPAMVRPDAPIPDLRQRFEELQQAVGGRDDVPELLTELDELVDAVNGLASLAGLDAVDTGGEPPPAPAAPERPPPSQWFLRRWPLRRPS